MFSGVSRGAERLDDLVVQPNISVKCRASEIVAGSPEDPGERNAGRHNSTDVRLTCLVVEGGLEASESDEEGAEAGSITKGSA